VMYRQYYPYVPQQMYGYNPYMINRWMYYYNTYAMYQYGPQNQHVQPNMYGQEANVENNPGYVQPGMYEQETNTENNPVGLNNESDPAFSHQFLNENGQVDVNKMLSTVGQLAHTVQEVSSVIKQVNDIIQSF